MDFASAIGLIVGIALILGAIMLEGDPLLYVSLHGLMIAFWWRNRIYLFGLPFERCFKGYNIFKEGFLC